MSHYGECVLYLCMCVCMRACVLLCVCACQDDKSDISTPSSFENLVDAGNKFGSGVPTSEAAAAAAANDVSAEQRPVPPGLFFVCSRIWCRKIYLETLLDFPNVIISLCTVTCLHLSTVLFNCCISCCCCFLVLFWFLLYFVLFLFCSIFCPR